MSPSLLTSLSQDLHGRWLVLKGGTDEIMHQDVTPLCAADIQDQLKKRFAYLSGGRGQDGSPVITFPDYPAFGDVPDKEFHDVLTYLTSIPSLQDAAIGFILVIDRRQDKWTSVKASVLRIAASFPAHLQLVLVLRPTGFFQRALSELAFKFSRDDFKMKVPVIMLSSVPELHGYIDKSQLTEDLGGTLGYCHSRWLYHRTAIEGFALMVKQTAQRLQGVGSELAETELPNDVPSTSSLLSAHAEKRGEVKEELRRALAEGQWILGSIREPLAADTERGLNQDQLDNETTMRRLLDQLNETEAAFDEFWEKHQQKLEQCLQLRGFEQDFREVKAALDATAQKLAALTDVGNSLAHAEHLLKELAGLEAASRAALERAGALALEGERLVGGGHYAEDSIRPKCRELRGLRDQLEAELGRRRDALDQSLRLHGLLEASLRWCDEGIYLLASQPVDKCQSQDGAEAALQDLQRFLATGAGRRLQGLGQLLLDFQPILTPDLREHVQKVFRKQESTEDMFQRRQTSLRKLAAKQTRPVQPVAPRPEALTKAPCPSAGVRRGSDNGSAQSGALRRGPYRRVKSELAEGRGPSAGEEEESLAVLRRHVMNELLDTERAYVEELLSVLEGYAAEMDNPLLAPLLPAGLQSKKAVLFGNMEEIYRFHHRIFLRELENYADCPELVGRCFLERMEEFQVYEKYCQNKPRSESLWRQCSDCPFFQECQRKLDHKLSLDSYLLKPVQRVTKYQLLLKEMLKYSGGCEGAEDLQEALSSILGILKAVNDSMHLIAITGYDGKLAELGRLLMQGSFSVWTDHKRGPAKVKDLARFKPRQRHLFLHEKALLFCKRREESGEGYEKAPSYSYKQSLSMAAVGITENVKGDTKKFEIWYNAREEVYTVQAPTPEVKVAWVTEIRKVLTSQLQACREASQHRALEQSQSLPTGTASPTKGDSRSTRKLEERKTDPLSLEGPVSAPALAPASPSPDKKAKRLEVKSDPTPFGLRGWSKTSQPPEAPEDNDGWSSAEDLIIINSSDAEEEGGGVPGKLAPGKFTVVGDEEKAGSDALALRSGDVVELLRQGDDGLWLVRNLTSSREAWVPPRSLCAALGPTGSAQCLSSSDSSAGSALLSASSSCSEGCGGALAELQG